MGGKDIDVAVKKVLAVLDNAIDKYDVDAQDLAEILGRVVCVISGAVQDITGGEMSASEFLLKLSKCLAVYITYIQSKGSGDKSEAQELPDTNKYKNY